ncbi:MAG: polysaccharide biosynthesis/export family protein [Steroidobacteraceae bacterium]
MRRSLCIFAACLLAGGTVRADEAPPQQVLDAEQLAAAETARVVLEQRTVDQQVEELARIAAEPVPAFRIGAGDQLAVTVYQEPDLSVERAVVRPDGYISLPLIGDVRAGEQAVPDLASDITTRLARYVLDPKVNVRLDDMKSATYTVYGEVVTPGTFPLASRTTISAAIARSGGLKQGNYRASTIEIADLRHAFIARDGHVLPVDFVRLLRDGDMRYDIELRPGDHIHVPSGLSQEVYVLGEVSKPMVFAYQDRMALARTLSMSEGFTHDADRTRIHVVRGSLQNPTVIVSNYKEVLSGRQRDVQLEPGDIIYVPTTGLASLSRILDYILPALTTVQNTVLLGRAAGGGK